MHILRNAYEPDPTTFPNYDYRLLLFVKNNQSQRLYHTNLSQPVFNPSTERFCYCNRECCR